MTIHDRNETTSLLPLRQLPAGTYPVASAIFDPAFPPVPNGRNADLRQLLTNSPLTQATMVGTGSMDDPATRRASTDLHAATEAHAAGHTFSIDGNLSLRELMLQTPPAEVMEGLGVPFTATPIIITIDQSPTLFVLRGDERGRLQQVTVALLCEDPDNGAHGLALRAWIQPDPRGLPVVDDTTTELQMLILTGLAVATRTLLLLVNDSRLPLKREVPDEKLNKRRREKGKPALPPIWHLDASRIGELYTTKLDTRRKASPGSSRSGTHRSPIPHDRRGHRRRLRSGAICWVKPSRVGLLIRHLRRRDFYRLEVGGGQ
ncbi:hypothetical protein G5V57_24370 [Nordella sp. HKS 07]|uniref:hypothetical protein n=1 Tax=Nordella sp. HKS 07 TaxID=2712222 RepID=UPI0013E16205|nr:hypothetical protein [Nordella sp. HKS 07]QIG50588.1 hypothetical protein G5V57_24370 [Nordella sp. HKS 07]